MSNTQNLNQSLLEGISNALINSSEMKVSKDSKIFKNLLIAASFLSAFSLLFYSLKERLWNSIPKAKTSDKNDSLPVNDEIDESRNDDESWKEDPRYIEMMKTINEIEADEEADAPWIKELRDIVDKNHKDFLEKLNNIDEKLNNTSEKINNTDEEFKKTDKKIKHLALESIEIKKNIKSLEIDTEDLKKKTINVAKEIEINQKIHNNKRECWDKQQELRKEYEEISQKILKLMGSIKSSENTFQFIKESDRKFDITQEIFKIDEEIYNLKKSSDEQNQNSAIESKKLKKLINLTTNSSNDSKLKELEERKKKLEAEDLAIDEKWKNQEIKDLENKEKIEAIIQIFKEEASKKLKEIQDLEDLCQQKNDELSKEFHALRTKDEEEIENESDENKENEINNNSNEISPNGQKMSSKLVLESAVEPVEKEKVFEGVI